MRTFPFSFSWVSFVFVVALGLRTESSGRTKIEYTNEEIDQCNEHVQPKTQIERLYLLFTSLDRNDCGTLSREELVQCTRLNQIKLNTNYYCIGISQFWWFLFDANVCSSHGIIYEKFRAAHF